MQRSKTHHDVLGWQMNCLNYTMCPLCYGCRAYNPSYAKCQRCTADGKKKFNVCNTELHTEKNLSLMITREVIDLDKNKYGGTISERTR